MSRKIGALVERPTQRPLIIGKVSTRNQISFTFITRECELFYAFQFISRIDLIFKLTKTCGRYPKSKKQLQNDAFWLLIEHLM